VSGTNLTALRRALLRFVTDDSEPTWIIVKELEEASGERATVEAALRDLEARGLLRGRRELSDDPDGITAYDDWWSLTEVGWERLGSRR
jgi:DNA-binding PadR family transcriptional regulator